MIRLTLFAATLTALVLDPPAALVLVALLTLACICAPVKVQPNRPCRVEV